MSPQAGIPELDRVRFFDGQRLAADDLSDWQQRVRELRWLHQRAMHSWGIAIDYDPDNNALHWGRDRASFALPAYDKWWDYWEAEGWVSLGRAKNFDWMHVQAARV